MEKQRCGSIGANMSPPTPMLVDGWPSARAETADCCNQNPRAWDSVTKTYPKFKPTSHVYDSKWVTAPHRNTVWRTVKTPFHETMTTLKGGKADSLKKTMAMLLEGNPHIWSMDSQARSRRMRDDASP